MGLPRGGRCPSHTSTFHLPPPIATPTTTYHPSTAAPSWMTTTTSHRLGHRLVFDREPLSTWAHTPPSSPSFAHHPDRIGQPREHPIWGCVEGRAEESGGCGAHQSEPRSGHHHGRIRKGIHLDCDGLSHGPCGQRLWVGTRSLPPFPSLPPAGELACSAKWLDGFGL